MFYIRPMIVQNPLVPPLPASPGTTASPVANAPAAAQSDRPETQRPVTAVEPGDKSAAKDPDRREPDDQRAERGLELDITA